MKNFYVKPFGRVLVWSQIGAVKSGAELYHPLSKWHLRTVLLVIFKIIFFITGFPFRFDHELKK